MRRCRNFFRCEEYVATDSVLCQKCDPKQYDDLNEPPEIPPPSGNIACLVAAILIVAYSMAMIAVGVLLGRMFP